MHTPSNTIITIVGFLMVFGAMGGMDTAPNSQLIALFGIACAGLCLMFAGVNGLTHTE